MTVTQPISNIVMEFTLLQIQVSNTNVIMHKWFINTLQTQGADESLDQVGIYVPTQVSVLVYSLVFIYYETHSSSTVCGCTTGTENSTWS